MPEIIVIIDGYSSGCFLAESFNNHGYHCVHIRTAYDLHPYYQESFDPHDYIETIDYRGDFDRLVRHLQQYRIAHVLAGFDMGVALSDRLNQYFGLSGNDPSLSLARRDKYQQRQALAQAGLYTLPFHLASDWQDLQNWLMCQRDWPWVLKPVNSASAQDVYCCQDLEQAKAAFFMIKGKHNHCGSRNLQVLVESFLQGREYRINTMSYAGKVVITDCWDMTKIMDEQGQFLYDQVTLLPAMGKIQDHLIQHIAQVLAALKIEYGPSTSDIIMTEDGPVLVELGARLMGGMLPIDILRQSIVMTQLDVMVMAYTDLSRFQSLPNRYELQNHLRIYLVRSQKTGVLESFRFLTEMEQLPSVKWLRPMIQPGDLLQVTCDYQTSPLHIVLSGGLKQIARDVAQIQHWEKEGLFQVVPPY